MLVILDVTEREQREELRREFTANVSHELKTPLTSISGIAEIIKGGLVKPQDIPGFADDIYGEAQRMIRLVEDILRLSQLDEGGSSLQTEEVDLYHLAQEVAGRLTPAAVKGQVTLEVTGGPVRISGVQPAFGRDDQQPVRQRHQVQSSWGPGHYLRLPLRPGRGALCVRHGHRYPS